MNTLIYPVGEHMPPHPGHCTTMMKTMMTNNTTTLRQQPPRFYSDVFVPSTTTTTTCCWMAKSVVLLTQERVKSVYGFVRMCVVALCSASGVGTTINLIHEETPLIFVDYTFTSFTRWMGVNSFLSAGQNPSQLSPRRPAGTGGVLANHVVGNG